MVITLKRLVERLTALYGVAGPPPVVDPFGIVLFENIAYLVSDERRHAAFLELKRQIGATPSAIAKTSDSRLHAAAAAGGVYPGLRASRMRAAARLVLDDFGGDAANVLREAPARRRRLLKRFPAIGDPGVDKMLLISRTEPVLALESNGLRVLTRIGFGTESKSYAATYKSVQRAFGEFQACDFELLIDAHVLLAHHGRELCKRTAPLCEPCPLKKACAFFQRSA